MIVYFLVINSKRYISKMSIFQFVQCIILSFRFFRHVFAEAINARPLFLTLSLECDLHHFTLANAR